MTARESGHVVLGVRYERLSTSRLKNVAGALAGRGWQLDEDGEGATIRFPPGTDATSPAFELLAAATLSGAPSDVRTVTATDGTGTAVDLTRPDLDAERREPSPVRASTVSVSRPDLSTVPASTPVGTLASTVSRPFTNTFARRWPRPRGGRPRWAGR